MLWIFFLFRAEKKSQGMAKREGKQRYVVISHHIDTSVDVSQVEIATVNSGGMSKLDPDADQTEGATSTRIRVAICRSRRSGLKIALDENVLTSTDN